jgi:hypothetical protein
VALARRWEPAIPGFIAVPWPVPPKSTRKAVGAGYPGVYRGAMAGIFQTDSQGGGSRLSWCLSWCHGRYLPNRLARRWEPAIPGFIAVPWPVPSKPTRKAVGAGYPGVYRGAMESVATDSVMKWDTKPEYCKRL